MIQLTIQQTMSAIQMINFGLFLYLIYRYNKRITTLEKTLDRTLTCFEIYIRR